MLSLLGLLVVVAGFALRLNPLLTVVLAAFASGLGGGQGPVQILSEFGRAFRDGRTVSVIWVVLPVIGLLEGHGLRLRAQDLISRLRRASAGRLLLAYLALRQVTAALGLTALGGHAAMVRPLIAPMAEAAAADAGPVEIPPALREEVRAHAAAADNVGAFFGEDVFVAFGSVLLIQATLRGLGVRVDSLALSLFALPSALLAFAVHGGRLLRLDRRWRAAAGETAAS